MFVLYYFFYFYGNISAAYYTTLNKLLAFAVSLTHLEFRLFE